MTTFKAYRIIHLPSVRESTVIPDPDYVECKCVLVWPGTVCAGTQYSLQASSIPRRTVRQESMKYQSTTAKHSTRLWALHPASAKCISGEQNGLMLCAGSPKDAGCSEHTHNALGRLSSVMLPVQQGPNNKLSTSQC